MKKSVQLNILNPCSENWQSMQPDQQGRFCNSCKKSVIDFTQMTDNELMTFFLKKREPVCGKFHPLQLNEELIVPVKKITFLKYFFKFTIPAFLFSLKSFAQTTQPKQEIITTNNGQKNYPEEAINNSPREIHGYIKDANNIPIPFASITVTGTSIGTVTDTSGKFNIKVPQDSKTLTVSSVGYIRSEIKISENMSDIVLVNLSPSILGEVVVVVRTRKIRKSNKLKSVEITKIMIYPNPVKTSSLLNISWEKPVTADQRIEIYDASGKLVQSEIKYIKNKSTLEKINLNLFQKGTYIIRITDSHSNKSQSFNFIAE